MVELNEQEYGSYSKSNKYCEKRKIEYSQNRAEVVAYCFRSDDLVKLADEEAIVAQ